MNDTLKNYVELTRLHQPIGIFLLLWPTLWALWAAGLGSPHLNVVCVFVLGTVVMRSAGCVMNDIADRDVDRFVERTRERPLTAGRISVWQASVVFCGLMAAAFLLVLTQNTYTIGLAFVGAGLTLIYPFLKRITHLPQVGLGVAFAWGVPMAFAAENNAIPLAGWVLFFAAVIWPVIYDTMYAMVDREDDLKVGIKSTAILFGSYDARVILGLQIAFLILLVGVGAMFQFTLPYYLSLLIVAGLFGYQQKLLRRRTREAYFQAFLNNNWVGFVIVVGVLLGAVL